MANVRVHIRLHPLIRPELIDGAEGLGQQAQAALDRLYHPGNDAGSGLRPMGFKEIPREKVRAHSFREVS